MTKYYLTNDIKTFNVGSTVIVNPEEITVNQKIYAYNIMDASSPSTRFIFCLSAIRLTNDEFFNFSVVKAGVLTDTNNTNHEGFAYEAKMIFAGKLQNETDYKNIDNGFVGVSLIAKNIS